MKALKFIILVVFLFIQLSCENSVEPEPSIVLIETSFEEGNQPSLQGWEDGFPYYCNRQASFSFSSETPTSSGQWSLKSIPPLDTTCTRLKILVEPKQPSSNVNFKLSFWSITDLRSNNFSVSLTSYSGNKSFSYPVGCDSSSSWKLNVLDYNSTELTIDSLVIGIAMHGPADTSKVVLFDNFKLQQY